MENYISEALVSKKTKIRNVIKKINANGLNGVFVAKPNREILGIITDSDIRKNILRNDFKKSTRAEQIMKKKFISIPQSKINLSKKLLYESNKILVPVLDKRKIIDYVHISDFNSLKFREKNRVLVIGGLGMIGSLLTKKLLNLGKKVNILDINFYNTKKIFKKKNKNLKIFIGDVNNKKILKKAISGCSSVIHLGEIVGDPAVSLNEKFSIKNNFEATSFLLNECIKSGIKRFIFTSSCSVYGFAKKKCNEKSKLNPVSLYAKCKVACEQQILSQKIKNFCPTILRLSTVYGNSPRLRLDLVVNRFVANAVKKKKLYVFGENCWRPMICVDDVCDGIIKILKTKKNKVSYQIFNLGSDRENYMIKDVAEIIKKNIKIKIDYQKQKDDPRNYRVSFSKIKKKINYKIKNNLKSYVKKLISIFKNKKFNIND